MKKIYTMLFIACFRLICFSGSYSLAAQEANMPPAWRGAIGGVVTGKPMAQAETVVLVTDGGNLTCYSNQGSQLWRYFAGGRLTPSVNRSREGTSYICRTNGALIAVNRSGRELWQKRLPAPLSSPVIIGWDGRLFAMSGRELSCMTAAGYSLWTQRFNAPIACGPEPNLSGGLLLMLEPQIRTIENRDENGSLVSTHTFKETGIYSINHLGRIQTFDIIQNIDESPPLLVFSIFADEGEEVREAIGLIYKNGNMAVIDSSGGLNALPSLPGPPLAAAYYRTQIAVSTSNGRTVLLNIGEDDFAWSGENHLSSNDKQETTRMIFDERGIYVVSTAGATGFSDDGSRLWILRLKGAAALPEFSDDGFVYSGGRDWILYAYKLEERIRAMRQSIYGPEPEGSYGMGETLPSLWGNYYYMYSDNDIRNRVNQIAGSVRQGSVGASEREFVSILMEIAASNIQIPGTRQLSPAVQTEYRVEALRLLSLTGSRETIPFLAAVFSREKEPVVKAAAAAAIGRIGVDPDAHALNAFSAFIHTPGLFPDERLLSSVITAIGSLCRFSGPPLADEGLRLLLRLDSPTMPRSVSKQVRGEIARLR